MKQLLNLFFLDNPSLEMLKSLTDVALFFSGPASDNSSLDF